jgi:hypothetical protein
MKTSLNNKHEAGSTCSRLFLLAAATLLLASTVSAGDGKGNLGNPGVMPPQSTAFGKTYGEWAMEGAKWFLSIPGAVHPSYDWTGERAAIGQQGKVWFLCGSASAPLLDPSPATVERRLAIPSGTAIFVGISCTFWATLPVDLDENGNPWLTDEEALAYIMEIEDMTTDLACEIDGKPVHDLQNYRCHTPAFSFTFPDLPPGETWWDYGWAPEDWLVPSGGWVSTPTIWDGTALLLAPLSVGEHTIHFTSSNPYWVSSWDITYHITVTGGQEAKGKPGK